MSAQPKNATAYAPATVGNAAVGFDLLGFCLDVAGDEAKVTRLPRSHLSAPVEIRGISGLDLPIPEDPTQNTASVALLTLRQELGIEDAFSLELKKGIPLGSGMGGSAASAVAAVVAANALLEEPVDNDRLLAFALAGEQVASGTAHPDNAAPALLGGLCAALPGHPLRTLRIPVPAGIQVVLVHPHLSIRTEDARALLRPEVPVKTAVEQMGHLAGFLAGCFQSDVDLIGRHLRDVWVEPQRKKLIPAFDQAQAAAMGNGALGFSISGAGPSVFAWTRSPADGSRVRDAITKVFVSKGIETDAFLAPISDQGARILHPKPSPKGS
jgi:homoserine kinase